MCTREELKSLLFKLILRVDQVASLSAKYQFNDEFYGNANGVRSHERNKIPLDAYMRARYADILRFQRAYIRYFVFADDPLMNFIVPLPPTSLTLFITNILTDIGQNDAPSGFHTTHSIMKFLQVSFSEQFASTKWIIFFCWFGRFYLFISSQMSVWCTNCSYFIEMIYCELWRKCVCHIALKCWQKFVETVTANAMSSRGIKQDFFNFHLFFLRLVPNQIFSLIVSPNFHHSGNSIDYFGPSVSTNESISDSGRKIRCWNGTGNRIQWWCRSKFNSRSFAPRVSEPNSRHSSFQNGTENWFIGYSTWSRWNGIG